MSKLRTSLILNRHKPFLFILVFALLGGVLLLFATHAVTPYTAIESEQGNKTAPATVVTDNTASGGQAVQFGGSSGTNPDPTKHNCAQSPHICGYPDATNTGVPSGTVLKRIPQDVTSGPGWSCIQSGSDNCAWVTISGNGTVFSGFSMINGPGLVIEANNVTVKNTEIQLYGQDNDGIKIGQVGSPADNVTVEDCTLHGIASGNTPNHMFVGILATFTATNITALRNNMYNIGVGIQYGGGQGLSKDNYIHDFGRYAYPPLTDTDHNVAIGYSSGGTIADDVEHNTFLNNLGNYVVEFNQDNGPMVNGTINNNLLAGGGYLISGGDAGVNGTTRTHDIRITSNRFSRLYYQNGGSFGTVASFTVSNPGNVESGNFWDDTGLPAN